VAEAKIATAPEPTTVPHLWEEIPTTVEEEEPHDIQIQGSDRKYPAIVLRRKHRGKGATILTISKHDNSGRSNPAYEDYSDNIQKYLDNRRKRLSQRESSVVGVDVQGGGWATQERWLSEVVQGVVGGQDNSHADSNIPPG